VASVTDSVANVTSYVHDSLNREVQMTDPLAHVATMAYDAASRLTSETDRLGRVNTFAYDNANKLTGETWLATGGTIVLNTQSWSYDNNGNILTAADNVGTYTLGYDALNRLTSQTDVFGLGLTFSYDSADRQTVVQDSLGGTLTSVYDNANRLTSRQFSGNSMQLRIDPGYNNRNDLTSLTRYGTTGTTMVVGTTTYGIDDAGRVTAITHQNGSSATLSYYNASYDAADRITQETWGSGGTTGTHVYSYDKVNQLLSDGSTTYSYDLNGNRTMGSYTTGTNNQITFDGTYTYTYDNEGNVTQKVSTTATWTYGWDNMNRLVGVKQVTTTGTQLSVSYSYDVLNQRVEDDTWKASTGTTVTVRHAFDDKGNIWADVTTTNTLLARYVYGDGVDQVWARAIPSGQPNSGVAWYLTDREGSVRDLMDNNSVIQDHIDYDGYGNATHTTVSFADSHGYAGGETDLNTGLVQEKNRWYEPPIGRWMSQDPIRFAGGDANLYRYVGNGPTDWTDPMGLASIRKVANPFNHDLLDVYYGDTYIGAFDPATNEVIRGAYRASWEDVEWEANHGNASTSREWFIWFKNYNLEHTTNPETRTPPPGSNWVQGVGTAIPSWQVDWEEGAKVTPKVAMVGIIWSATGPLWVSPTSKIPFRFNAKTENWASESGDVLEGEELAAANAAKTSAEKWQAEVDALQDAIADLQQEIDEKLAQEVGFGQNRVTGSMGYLKELMGKMADLMARKPYQ
jgi:RHS repeat-associated protein